MRNDLLSTEVPELDVDCELKWVRLDMTGAKSLYIGAFYRPPSSDAEYLSRLDAHLGDLHTRQALTYGWVVTSMPRT